MGDQHNQIKIIIIKLKKIKKINLRFIYYFLAGVLFQVCCPPDWRHGGQCGPAHGEGQHHRCRVCYLHWQKVSKCACVRPSEPGCFWLVQCVYVFLLNALALCVVYCIFWAEATFSLLFCQGWVCFAVWLLNLYKLLGWSFGTLTYVCSISDVRADLYTMLPLTLLWR